MLTQISFLGWWSNHCSKHLLRVLFQGSQEREVISSGGEKRIFSAFPKACLTFMYTSFTNYPQTVCWKLTLLTLAPQISLKSQNCLKTKHFHSPETEKQTYSPPEGRPPPLNFRTLSMRGGWLVFRAPSPPESPYPLLYSFKEPNPHNAHSYFLTASTRQNSLNWAMCRALWSSKILNYNQKQIVAPPANRWTINRDNHITTAFCLVLFCLVHSTRQRTSHRLGR